MRHCPKQRHDPSRLLHVAIYTQLHSSVARHIFDQQELILHR
jgi:hypothetical protein